MSLTARRRRHSLDIWPGFVDALTSLIMVLIFVMLIFSIGQFVLSDTLAGKNRALDALHLQVASLAKTLSLSEEAKRGLDERVAELTASLEHTRGERDRFKTAAEQATDETAALNANLAALTELKHQLEAEIAKQSAQLATDRQDLVKQTELNAQATAQVELLNRQMAAVNEQLKQLAAALDIANRDIQAKDVKIADLGQQLNLALAKQVGELERYRSEFFGKLREALGDRADVRVVGDRFVLPTDILFDSGSADLGGDAEARISRLVATLRELTVKIPSNIDWVLRIDGHTDSVPIHTDRFPSNWELSTARALAIVKYLVAQGIPAQRLSANGFGQFQPLDIDDTPQSHARNRRIELQLTNR